MPLAALDSRLRQLAGECALKIPRTNVKHRSCFRSTLLHQIGASDTSFQSEKQLEACRLQRSSEIPSCSCQTSHLRFAYLEPHQSHRCVRNGRASLRDLARCEVVKRGSLGETRTAIHGCDMLRFSFNFLLILYDSSSNSCNFVLNRFQPSEFQPMPKYTGRIQGPQGKHSALFR